MNLISRLINISGLRISNSKVFSSDYFQSEGGHLSLEFNIMHSVNFKIEGRAFNSVDLLEIMYINIGIDLFTHIENIQTY